VFSVSAGNGNGYKR